MNHHFKYLGKKSFKKLDADTHSPDRQKWCKCQKQQQTYRHYMCS